MISNLPIVIYTAGGRTAKQWKRTPTTISEFVKRLEMSQELPCTRTEYLTKKKTEQDRLKDIGGYVLGELQDGHRRNGCVINRCAVVLDLDNLPAGSTEDVTRRVCGLGVAAVIHSTAKHAPEAPRLRVIVFLNRPISADEYSPIVRRLAQLIQPEMSWFDHTTAEATRLMYWATHCSDITPVFCAFDGGGLLDADDILAQYQDWRDVSEWPRFTRESRPEKLAAKQGDPLEKPGVVGAFCRTYDIRAAMDRFLPGVYDPCDLGEDRFTFTGGSTAGGAVLYDGGKFLYSHHATDPCSGKLVNAFDLVRLHLFGDQDDDAKPDTPVNKLPSYLSMTEFARRQPEVIALENEERGAGIAQDFGGLCSSDRKDFACFLGSLKGEQLTASVIADLLGKLGIAVRMNVISGETEIIGAPQSWSFESTVNNLPVYLKDWLKRAGAKGVSKDAICDCLALIGDEQRYNPVMQMLYAFSWDGVDRLQAVYEILGISGDQLSMVLVKKWMWQSVALAHNVLRSPFGADGVLTTIGAQGIGKTSFFRWLSYDPNWFREGVALNFAVKDSLINALGAWICELGELGSTLKRDIDQIKAFLLSTSDNIRRPYARNAEMRPRYTSFCATVNDEDFLKDETGNRRFWTVPVSRIDLERMRGYDRLWVQQLWAQVLTFYNSNPQGFRLTREEQRALELRNREHEIQLPFEEAVMQLMDFSLPVDRWRYVSAADLVVHIAGATQKDTRQIGRVLAKMSREYPGRGRKKVMGKRLYTVPLKEIIQL